MCQVSFTPAYPRTYMRLYVWTCFWNQFTPDRLWNSCLRSIAKGIEKKRLTHSITVTFSHALPWQESQIRQKSKQNLFKIVITAICGLKLKKKTKLFSLDRSLVVDDIPSTLQPISHKPITILSLPPWQMFIWIHYLDLEIHYIYSWDSPRIELLSVLQFFSGKTSSL